MEKSRKGNNEKKKAAGFEPMPFKFSGRQAGVLSEVVLST